MKRNNFQLGRKLFVVISMWMILSLVGIKLEEIREIRRQRKELLSRGHFPIRKWCLNESSALEGKSITT